jgi:hypothetical protein
MLGMGVFLQGDCDLEIACAPWLSGSFLEHVIDVMLKLAQAATARQSSRTIPSVL